MLTTSVFILLLPFAIYAQSPTGGDCGQQLQRCAYAVDSSLRADIESAKDAVIAQCTQQNVQ